MAFEFSKNSILKDSRVRLGLGLGAIIFLSAMFSHELFPDIHKKSLAAGEISLYDLNYTPIHEDVSFDGAMLRVYEKDTNGTIQMKEVPAKEVIKQNAIIHFWDTWCAPCVRELPHYDGVIKRQSHVEHVTVITGKKTKPSEVFTFLDQKNIKNVRVIFDYKSALAKRLNVSALPTTIFVRHGQVLGGVPGIIQWEKAQVEELVFKIFKKG